LQLGGSWRGVSVIFSSFIIVIVLVSSYTTIRWNLEAVSCSDTKTSKYIEEVEAKPKGKASSK
jgi:hypothetical protein